MKTMILAALILLAVSVRLGIWIGLTGSPYNVILLAVHKLTSIGFTVLSGIYFIGEMRNTGMAPVNIVLIAVMIAAFVALLATGAIMSGQQLPSAILRITHAAMVIIFFLSAGWRLLLYFIR